MCLFKHMVYFLLVCVSMVGLPASAEPAANPETTNTSTLVTELGIEELKAQITKTQTAITEARKVLQTEEKSLQRKINRLETTNKIGQKRLKEAAKKRHLGNQKIEELRVQRQHLQNTLDKQSADMAELQTTLEELNLIESAERTQEQNQQRSSAEKDIALYQKAVDLGQQHLQLLNQQTDLAIKQTILAIEWHSQLQAAHETRRIQEQEQALADHQATHALLQENLEAEQSDLPNKIAALETTESTVEMLRQPFEKAALDKQKAAVEINNLESEHQSAKTRLDNQTKFLQKLENKLEQLSKTPPVEPEQIPLHDKRIAVLENNIELQKKARELEQQQLEFLTQRLEPAKKQLAIATQWYDKLEAVYQKHLKEQLEKQLRQKQQSYQNQAAELRQQLDLIPDLEENEAKRQLLEVQIQEANELAQKAERQLQVRQIQTQFRHWRAMARERHEAKDITQTQLDKTKAALTELNTLLQEIQASQTLLEEKRQYLNKQLDMVKEQGEHLSDQALTDNTQTQKLLKKIRSTWRQELRQHERFLKKGNQLLTRLEKFYKENVHQALFRQRQLPSSAVEWWSLLTEIGTIPNIVWQKLQHSGRGFWQAFQQTSNSRWLIISIALLIWLSLVIGLRAWTNRILNPSTSVNGRILKHLGHKSSNLPKLPSVIDIEESSSLLPAGLRLWHQNTLSIAVTGVFLLLILLTQPNQLTSIVTLILLLTWLGGQVLVTLSEFLLSVSALQSLEHTKLYRQLRWTMIVLALFTVITALIHLEYEGQVGLSLTARDLVDTLFMILLSLSIPIFMRMRLMILALMRTNQSKGYWQLAINLITLLLPGFILVVSILGVMGYIALGWKVAHYLGLFLLVLGALLIVLGIINDLIKLWKKWAFENSPYGPLWAEELIPLLHNLLGLALIGLGVIAFFWLTGWYSDVAIMENIEKVVFFSLFTFENGNQITVLGILLSLLLVWVVFWLGGWFRRVSYQWIFIRITDIGIRHSLSVFIQYVVVLVGLLIVLKTIGIDPTALVVFAGAIGVGIGFGLQNIADNFISGILLLIERPLRVGDFVEVESPQGAEFKYSGTVTKIGIRSMTLETEDSKKVVVPNSGLISGPFVNWASSTEEDEVRRRTIVHTDLEIGISYDSDPHLADKLLKQVLEETPEVLRDPTFEIYLSEFADFKMTFHIDYYIDTDLANSIEIKSKVLFGIWDRFKAAGIKIPSPSGMYLHSVS